MMQPSVNFRPGHFLSIETRKIFSKNPKFHDFELKMTSKNLNLVPIMHTTRQSNALNFRRIIISNSQLPINLNSLEKIARIFLQIFFSTFQLAHL